MPSGATGGAGVAEGGGEASTMTAGVGEAVSGVGEEMFFAVLFLTTQIVPAATARITRSPTIAVTIGSGRRPPAFARETCVSKLRLLIALTAGLTLVSAVCEIELVGTEVALSAVVSAAPVLTPAWIAASYCRASSSALCW